MAEEAFALSPISARASLPSEADYDAIREAFMETSRGRWFLSEYAKRNRNADTSMVLDAVARIEQTIAAQKQASANELIDSLGAIRAIVGEARASVAQALAGLAGGETLAAAHDGARIIREIARTLRECGADARICDLLDSQVGAIDAGHRQVAAVSSEAILATFDLLMRRIGELADADAPDAGDVMSSDHKQAAATAPTAEDQPATAAIKQVAEAETTAARPTDEIATPVQHAAPEPAAEQPVAHLETAPDAETATPSELAPHAETAMDIGFAPQAEIEGRVEIEALTEAAAQIGFEPVVDHIADSEAALDPEDATFTSAAQGFESESQQPDETSVLDPETAHEVAVLDLVALEMAAEDFVDESVDELPNLEPAPVEPAPVETASSEPADIELADTELAELETIAAEPAVAALVDLEPRVSFATIAAAQAPPTGEASASAPPPSLGAALIASGTVAKPVTPGIDPLAPIRRMTQIEKIAFFS